MNPRFSPSDVRKPRIPSRTSAYASRAGLGELAELGGGTLGLIVLQQRLGGLSFGVHVTEDLGNAIVHLARNPLSLLGDRQRPHLAVETRVLDSQGGERRKRASVSSSSASKVGSASFSVR